MADDDPALAELMDIGPQPQAQGLDAQQIDSGPSSQRASYSRKPVALTRGVFS